jgi:hypothetical protein
VSKFVVVLLGALVSALILSSTASAGVSKYCKLIPGQAIARPVRASNVKTSSVAIPNPSLTKAKGRLTLCTHRTRNGVVAQTSVAALSSAKAAKGEFAALIHRQKRNGAPVLQKTRGPWNDAYFMGQDGLLVLKGRYMFHIQYASGAPGYSSITAKTLTGLAGRAVAKL